MLGSNGLLIPKQALKPGGRGLGVAHRVLDRFVAETGLQTGGTRKSIPKSVKFAPRLLKCSPRGGLQA